MQTTPLVPLIERVAAAAEERQLSQNSLLAYRRTWLKIIAWAAAEGLALEPFPPERVGEFYEEATRGRSASHHLQVKAALALLYHVLGSPNPFAQCPAPKFAPNTLQIETTPTKGQLQNFVEIGQTRFAGEQETARQTMGLTLLRTVRNW